MKPGHASEQVDARRCTRVGCHISTHSARTIRPRAGSIQVPDALSASAILAKF